MKIHFDMAEILPNISVTHHPDTSVKVFNLSEGKPLALTDAPPGIDESPVHDALGQLLKFENARQSVLTDKRLSDLGRAERLGELYKAEADRVRDEVGLIEKRVQQTESHLIAATREAYGPQPLLESNAVGAMNDHMVMTHCLSLTGPELNATLKAIQAGEKLYFVQAMVRMQALGFDLPAAWAAVIPEVWAKHCERIRPTQVAKANLLSAEAAWQRDSISRIQAKLPAGTKMKVTR